MTYSAPFPLVQFQFQIGFHGSPPDSRGPQASCGTDRWRVQPSPSATRPGQHSPPALRAIRITIPRNMQPPSCGKGGAAMRARAMATAVLLVAVCASLILPTRRRALSCAAGKMSIPTWRPSRRSSRAPSAAECRGEVRSKAVLSTARRRLRVLPLRPGQRWR